MLGDRYAPNPNTTTDPFATLPQFPSPSKMTHDHDDRSSSVSDNDDSCSVQLNGSDKLGVKNTTPLGKKTRGRVRIEMQYIQNKLRRYTTFSKRKSGIMKKAYELSTLTGTQVMLLVASETGHVYTFATPKLQPMITSEAGKALIQTCLHQPDQHSAGNMLDYDMRMSATGFEETDLGYQLSEDTDFKTSMHDPSLQHVAVSTATPMHAIVNPGAPVVTIPHGMMPMHGFPTTCAMPTDCPQMTTHNPVMSHAPMAPIHSSPQAMSPHHSSPPPTYSPPNQPGSPPRGSTYANSYPGSPPQGGPMAHQPVMMEDLGSPSLTHHHTIIDSYVDRSPSRSPIQHHKYIHGHSPQGLCATPIRM